MIKRVKYLVLLLLLFSIPLAGCKTADVGKASAESEVPVVEIASIEIGNNTVEIKISGAYSPSYTVYKPSDPYTVVVELAGVQAGSVPEKIESDKEGISEVTVIQMQGNSPLTKIEVLLDAPTTLDASYEDGVILLTVADAMAVEEASGDVMQEPADLSPATEITGMSFDRTNGFVRLVIMGNGTMSPEIYTLDKRMILDVAGVTMADGSLPLDVVAPVKDIRQGMYNGKTRIIVDFDDKTDFIATTVDDAIVLSFRVETSTAMMAEPMQVPEYAEEAPTEKAELSKLAEMEAAVAAEAGAGAGMQTEQLVSLDFQDADIKPIIRLLAGDVGGFNIVINPDVTGKTNLKLTDVEWDRALEIILKQNNLSSKIDGNIMWVAPTAVFRQQANEEAAKKQTYEKVAVLRQQVIHLEHIAADEMATRITEAKVLSARGKIRIDERMNNIIINDTDENIARIIAEEVPYWDTPEHGTMQVLIEAKIVEVGSEYLNALGIRWSGTGNQDNLSFVSDEIEGGFGINTPVGAVGTNPGGIITIGYAETFNINMSLEALESIGQTRKLANPRIITIDKQSATIEQGSEIPFSTTSAEGTETKFEKMVLSLTVTPEIQPNEIIKLTVQVTNDTPKAFGSEIGKDTQSLKTQAFVKNGHTLVLGGIYTNLESNTETRVPLLGNIPFLGWLFKTQSRTNSPKELLVFITPRIVK